MWECRRPVEASGRENFMLARLPKPLHDDLYCLFHRLIPQHRQQVMEWSRLWRPFAGKNEKKMPAVTQKVACTSEHRRTSLLDLPESLITKVLRCLDTKSKCQAELVCSSFRSILSRPSPGDFVWDIVDLRDSAFQSMPLDALNRQAAHSVQIVLEGMVLLYELTTFTLWYCSEVLHRIN